MAESYPTPIPVLKSTIAHKTGLVMTPLEDLEALDDILFVA
jgi:hypothetical protein